MAWWTAVFPGLATTLTVLAANLSGDSLNVAYEEGLVSEIYIPGENTFGSGYPSTSELMKRCLVQRGVPEASVHTAGGLNSARVSP